MFSCQQGGKDLSKEQEKPVNWEMKQERGCSGVK